ncbi:MAG: SET domain-containing protein-lysine N-methyltransferase [Dehalococcoidia bacterium]
MIDGLWVGPSKVEGEGLFTARPIKRNATVIIWGGVVVTMADFKAGKGLAHSNVGLAEDVYLASPPEDGLGLDDCMNHSCDPNLWLNDEITLVARRDIDAGEELTIDYAIELLDQTYVMKTSCNCGAASCRGQITGRDWSLPQVYETYEAHLAPFVQRRLERMRRDREGNAK